MRRTPQLTWTIALGVALAHTSCASSGKTQRAHDEEAVSEERPQTAQAAATPVEPPLHPGPPKPWADMSHDERKAYMKDTVVPTMEPIFKAYDEDYFEDFGCPTCHGPGVKSGTFEMPNPHIPAMFPSGSAEQREIIANDREWLVFMFNEVVPNMGDLLGLPRYDKETKTGFTCFFCHPKGTPAL